MKILTREDIDMSVQDDLELVRKRKEARREMHDAMKKAWTDSSKQRTEHNDREIDDLKHELEEMKGKMKE